MDGTGAYAWPGGSRLAGDLPPVIGLGVADLGCGRGACGRAALAGGASRVIFCDGDPAALAAVRADLPEADTALHEWGDPLPGGPYDLILGGDILYRPALHHHVLRSIASSLNANGEAWLSDPRHTLEEELPELAHSMGLSLRQKRRPAGYTLVRIGWAANA
jgi:predicted nicotinamide N-methyase